VANTKPDSPGGAIGGDLWPKGDLEELRATVRVRLSKSYCLIASRMKELAILICVALMAFAGCGRIFSGGDPEYANIHGAALEGSPAAVQAFLRRGADINGFDRHGETPLHSAVKGGNEETATLLIEEGADLNIGTTRGGDTPLHYAVMWANWDIVRILLKSGADENKPNVDGVSPKEYVVQQGTKELYDAAR